MNRLEPSFDSNTNTLTIPNSQWATYSINGERVKGKVVIEEETTVTASPKAPARFRDGTEAVWTYSPGQTPDADPVFQGVATDEPVVVEAD